MCENNSGVTNVVIHMVLEPFATPWPRKCTKYGSCRRSPALCLSTSASCQCLLAGVQTHRRGHWHPPDTGCGVSHMSTIMYNQNRRPTLAAKLSPALISDSRWTRQKHTAHLKISQNWIFNQLSLGRSELSDPGPPYSTSKQVKKRQGSAVSPSSSILNLVCDAGDGGRSCQSSKKEDRAQAYAGTFVKITKQLVVHHHAPPNISITTVITRHSLMPYPPSLQCVEHG